MDLAQALLQQKSQGQLNRQDELAKMLLQSGQKTTNPLVAALSGFLGTHELSRIADKQGELDDAALAYEIEQKQKKEETEAQRYEREFGLKERELGLKKEQIAIAKQRLFADMEIARQKLAAEGVKLTKGEEAVDKKFADELVNFTARGGFADMKKGIDQLREVRESLAGGGISTGKERAVVPDALQAVVFPDSFGAQERVEEIVQRNLREILGAQFTEKEGDRLIKRAFNPDLPEEENLARLDRLIASIESAAEAKRSASSYFAQNGTLKGWSGQNITLGDIESAVIGDDKSTGFKILKVE